MLFTGPINMENPKYSWPAQNTNLLADIWIKIQTVHTIPLA
jgi:hypothetical protein